MKNDYSILQLQGPRGLIRFSPDSSVAGVVENSSLRLIDIESQKVLFEHCDGRRILDFAVVARPDLRVVLVFKGQVEVVDPVSGEVEAKLDLPFEVADTVLHAIEKRALIIGSSELALIDLDDLSLVRAHRDKAATYFHVGSNYWLSFKGSEVVESGAGDERVIKVPGEILVASAYGDSLLLGLRDRRLMIVDKKTRAVTATCRWHATGSLAVALEAGGRAFSAGAEQVLLAWQPGSGKMDFLPRLGGEPRSLEVSGDGRYIGLSLANGTALVVDSQSFRPVLTAKNLRLPAAPRAPLARGPLIVPGEAGQLELTRLRADGLRTHLIRAGEREPQLFELSLDGRFLAAHSWVGDFCWLQFFELVGEETPVLELNNKVRMPRPLVALRAGFDGQTNQNFFLASDAKSLRIFSLQRDARGQFSFIESGVQSIASFAEHRDAFLAGQHLGLALPGKLSLFGLEFGVFKPKIELPLPSVTAVEACGDLIAVACPDELVFVDPEAAKVVDRWRFNTGFIIQGDGKGLLLLCVPKLKTVALLRGTELVNRWSLPFSDVRALWLADGHSLVAFSLSAQVAIFDFDFEAVQTIRYTPVHQELAEKKESDPFDALPKLSFPKLVQLLEFNEQSALLPPTDYFTDKLLDLCLLPRLK